MDRYKPHKQKFFGYSIIFKSVKGSWGQKFKKHWCSIGETKICKEKPTNYNSAFNDCEAPCTNHSSLQTSISLSKGNNVPPSLLQDLQKVTTILFLIHKKFLIITSCRYRLHLVFVGQLIKWTRVRAVQFQKERRNCPRKRDEGGLHSRVIWTHGCLVSVTIFQNRAWYGDSTRAQPSSYHPALEESGSQGREKILPLSEATEAIFIINGQLKPVRV